MQIVNGTSHEIKVYLAEDCFSIQDGRKLILKPGATPVKVIPAGINLNAQKGTKPADAGYYDFPVTGAVVFTGYDSIPDGDIIVVSNLYRSAVKELGGDTSRLATVNGTVYKSEEDLRPCGCTSLAIG